MLIAMFLLFSFCLIISVQYLYKSSVVIITFENLKPIHIYNVLSFLVLVMITEFGAFYILHKVVYQN